MSFGFRVLGFGFRVSCSGYCVLGFALRVWGLGFGGSGLWFWVPGFELRSAGFGISDGGRSDHDSEEIRGFRFGFTGFGFRFPSFF